MVSQWLEHRKAKAECPLCGRQRLQRKFRFVYGKRVCHSCCFAFANRRHFAYIIDNVFLFFVVLVPIVALSLLLELTVSTVPPDEIDHALGWIAQLSYPAAFLLKDGIAGRSFGKLLMGVHVVDSGSGKPIGFKVSFKRNLPLLLPLVPLVGAVQLIKGPRIGEGWAGTKVIWNRYADHPLFAVAADEAEAPFQQADIPVETVEDGDNPYRAPVT